MKFLLKTCLLVTCFNCIVNFLPGQVSGYKGKKFLLKTNLITPLFEKGYNVELESILMRDLTVSVDISQQNKLNDFNDKQPRDTSSYYNNSVGLKIRSYLNKAIPAPLGVYSFLSCRFGKTRIETTRWTEQESIYGQGQILRKDSYTFDKIDFLQFGMGWGYQTILKDRISIDAGWALVFTKTKTPEYSLYIASRENGRSLFSLSNILGSNYHNWGISIHASIGLLIF